MAIVPYRLGDKVDFYATRMPAFVEHSGELGLTPEEAAALQMMVDEAKAASTAQYQAQLAARSATLRYNLAVEALGSAGAKAIATIRARAETMNDPTVLQLASIPTIAARSPMAEPGTPSQLRVTMNGPWLELAWRCKNPKGSMGTVYHIARRFDMSDPFVYLGLSGSKKFTDKTVPAGATSIEYEIRAVRSTKAGVAANFPIRFGSNGVTMPGKFVPSRAGKTMLAA